MQGTPSIIQKEKKRLTMIFTIAVKKISRDCRKKRGKGSNCRGKEKSNRLGLQLLPRKIC